MTLELEVIQAVGQALARLSDPDAQARVIRWINDRFQQQAAAARPSAPKDAPRPGKPLAADPFLQVDELDDLFEGPARRMHREAEADPGIARQPEAEVGIDSLVRGFVTDFQRVALEWQGA